MKEVKKERIEELLLMVKDLPMNELLVVYHFIGMIFENRFTDGGVIKHALVC